MSVYYVKYECLAINFPLINGDTYLNHKINKNNFSTISKELISSKNNVFAVNYKFQNIVKYGNEMDSFFITLEKPDLIEFEADDLDERTLLEQAIKIVDKQVTKLEHSIMLLLNLPVFLETIKVQLFNDNKEEIMMFPMFTNRPNPKWSWIQYDKKVNLSRRLNVNFDMDLFHDFISKEKTNRIKKAYEYYINSFYVQETAPSFVMLCAAIDAITGINYGKETKTRFSKYASILFYEPLLIQENSDLMQKLYNLRSKYVHGKGNQITKENEVELRELVRKFILVYYLFWKEMKIKHDFELLSKLDEIHNDHTKYVEYAPATYAFVRLMFEHEKSTVNIFNMSQTDKQNLITKIFSEAFEKKNSK